MKSLENYRLNETRRPNWILIILGSFIALIALNTVQPVLNSLTLRIQVGGGALVDATVLDKYEIVRSQDDDGTYIMYRFEAPIPGEINGATGQYEREQRIPRSLYDQLEPAGRVAVMYNPDTPWLSMTQVTADSTVSNLITLLIWVIVGTVGGVVVGIGWLTRQVDVLRLVSDIVQPTPSKHLAPETDR
jgi:hypothetical protein